jgi:MFS transporter, SP family, solute carrier family 2 (myo-inositol transporter), member 13
MPPRLSTKPNHPKATNIPLNTALSRTAPNAAFYGKLLLFIAGMGGLLYGIDVGIIAAALLYLSKTISLTVEQTSIIVAAVLGGSMFSSLVAGVLADWFGRKKMMIVSGLMFVASVG